MIETHQVLYIHHLQMNSLKRTNHLNCNLKYNRLEIPLQNEKARTRNQKSKSRYLKRVLFYQNKESKQHRLTLLTIQVNKFHHLKDQDFSLLETRRSKT